jgi:hypothetical protein
MEIVTPRTYHKYRNLIETGDLFLFNATDPVSWLISLKTRKYAPNDITAKATHAAMAYWSEGPTGINRLWILESVLFGVTQSYLSNRIAWYLPHGDIYWHKMRTEYRPYGAQAADKILEKIGTYYDFQDLILQAFKRAVLDPTRLYCSEAVVWGWKDIRKLPDDFPVPYPCEMTSDRFGVYEQEGVRIE